MGVFSLFYFLILLSCLLIPKLTDGAACNSNSDVGVNNPQDKSASIDTQTGLTILLNDQENEYEIRCCGVITGWDYYAKTNTGTVAFQVWRQGGSTWTLVGENNKTITATNALQSLATPTSERIFVQNGDILGLHFASAPVISYSDAGWNSQYHSTTTYTTGASTFNWNAIPQNNQRDYAFHANTEPTTAPTITVPTSPLEFPDSTTSGTLLYTLVVSDVDIGDTVTTTITSNGNPGQLGFDPVSFEIRTTTSPLTSGTYNMVFTASDICDQATTATVTISLYNVPPTIHNLPASYDLSEDQSTQMTLFMINATDPNDVVTCSITTPATSPFSTKLTPGTSNYEIYVKASQNLDYLTQRQYDLTIECTDLKDPVTGSFTVYLTKNAQPSFTNLQNRVELSANTGSGVSVFTVEATDPENDNLNFRLTCYELATCPFSINSVGKITTAADMSSYTVPGYDVNVYVRDDWAEVGPKILTVIMTDINSAPIITNLPLPSAITVDENTALGTLLYTVKVLDINVGDTLTFAVISNPLEGLTYFDINTTSGEVKTSSVNSLNYEDLSTGSIGTTFTLTIFVFDGKETVSKDLVINLLNINEAPYFQKDVFGINGDENMVGNTLSNPGFSVTDPEGDMLYYRLECGQYSAYFTIHETTADITVTQAYDLDIASNSALITCTVTSIDLEFTSTATVEITINDVNDNAPVFSQSYYTFYLTPFTGINTVVGTITATDADTGSFGTLYYDLNQTVLEDEYFGLSGSSLYVRTDLTVFNYGSILTAVGIVTDGGGLQDTATIYFIMADTTSVTITTTTTERYFTFFEDSRNTAWFTAFLLGIAAAGLTLVYLIYKYGRIGDKQTKRTLPTETQRYPAKTTGYRDVAWTIMIIYDSDGNP